MIATVAILKQKQKIFYASLFLLSLLMALYMYFVSAAIAHVVVRKELNSEIAAMHTRMSELESQYIIEKGRIGEHEAIARGFTKNETRIFIGETGALSFHNEN